MHICIWMCVSLTVSMAAGPKKKVVFTLSDGVKFLSQRPKGLQAEIAGSDEGMVVVRKQETFDKFVHDRKCFMRRHCPKIEVPMGSNSLWFVGLLSIRTASCRFEPLPCDFHWDPMPVMVKASYDAKACTIMSGTRYSVASAIVRSAEIWSTSIDIQQLIRSSRSLQDLDQTLPTTSQAAHTVWDRQTPLFIFN